MVQAEPIGRVSAQVLLPGAMAKSPLTAMVSIESGVPPLLVRVTVCGEEPRPTPVAGKLIPKRGESETPGGAMPVPLSVTVCARYWSETVRVPAPGPRTVGWKMTPMVQVE
jgi:hypothetical protein